MLSLLLLAASYTPAEPPRAPYEIDCTLDLSRSVLHASEVVRLRNTGKRPLERVAVAWAWPAAFDSIRANGTAVDSRRVQGMRQAVIPLPAAVAPGAELHLEIVFRTSFTFRPPVYVTQGWFPRVVWGERQADDFTARVRAPEGYRVFTAGRWDAAAGTWNAIGLRSFALVLTKDTPVLEADAAGVHIAVPHSAAGAECARFLMESAARIVPFYKQRFGVYPHAGLVIIPGGTEPVGGYPVASGVVAIHGQEKFAARPATHWEWITAHEIGHQYWSEHVLAEGPDSLGWLMLGLGLRADREYSRTRGLEARHAAFMQEYTQAVRDGYDTTLDRTAEQFQALRWDYNNKVLHAKGYSVVAALEATLGTEVFERVHARALRDYAGRRLGWRAFQRLAEDESGEDLSWFFEQWVRTSRFASYEVTGIEKDGRAEVRSQGTLLTPVPIEAEFEDGTKQLQWTDRLLETQKLVFISKSPLKQARVDPAGALPLVIPPPDLKTARLHGRIAEMPWSGAGAEARALFVEAKKAGLKERGDWFKLGLLLYDDRADADALEAMQTATRLSQSSRESAPSLAWQGHLLDLLDRREEALAAYRTALAAWPEGMTQRHDQWKMRIDRTWLEERLRKPFARP